MKLAFLPVSQFHRELRRERSRHGLDAVSALLPLANDPAYSVDGHRALPEIGHIDAEMLLKRASIADNHDPQPHKHLQAYLLSPSRQVERNDYRRQRCQTRNPSADRNPHLNLLVECHLGFRSGTQISVSPSVQNRMFRRPMPRSLEDALEVALLHPLHMHLAVELTFVP